MKCPYCGNQEDHVLDSRPVRDGLAIRRRRQCVACSQRFTTFEEIEERRLMIVKKDGSRESFDRSKVRKGISIACRKRPVTTEQIDNATDEIERALMNRLETEAPSRDVGELIMEQLSSLDPVAYVRFASVYQEFEDPSQFKEMVDSMIKGKRRRGKDTGKDG